MSAYEIKEITFNEMLQDDFFDELNSDAAYELERAAEENDAELESLIEWGKDNEI